MIAAIPFSTLPSVSPNQLKKTPRPGIPRGLRVKSPIARSYSHVHEDRQEILVDLPGAVHLEDRHLQTFGKDTRVIMFMAPPMSSQCAMRAEKATSVAVEYKAPPGDVIEVTSGV
jgi:hypothetical protein